LEACYQLRRCKIIRNSWIAVTSVFGTDGGAERWRGIKEAVPVMRGTDPANWPSILN
jgi:hypothetical protein